MGVRTLQFDPKFHAAFEAQSRGVDAYSPGKRCRAQLADILGWGLDVDELRRAVAEDGVVILSNLPVDPELPISPPHGKRPLAKKTVVSECLLNGVSQILGMHPVSFHNEKDGDLIHQIVPVPGHEGSASNQGAHQFHMHTEATHTRLPPDVLALCCVRNTERGETNFTQLAGVLTHASDDILAELRKPNFTQAMGVSSGGGGRYSLPILSGYGASPIFRLDFTDVEATTTYARHALAWLEDYARYHEQRVALQPGQMIVLNNHITLHGRVGFTPDYSERKQRWLQRQYMTRHPLAGKAYDNRYPHVWDGTG